MLSLETPLDERMLFLKPKNNQYGFYDRLTADFPSQIIVDATEVCNLACIHCPHPEFKKTEHYNARNLDVGLHHKMVDEVQQHAQNCTQYIRYTSNGEPLVHPHIYDMLDYAVKNSDVSVTLTTNGTLLNASRVEKLLASGLHIIDISIDALHSETYAKIRVGGKLEVTRNNVLHLLEMKRRIKADTRIVVSFVEQPENLSEMLNFERYWKSQGVDFVVIRRLHSGAGGVSKIANDLQNSQTGKNRYPCLYPWERITLNPKGELAFCPQDWSHGSIVANYKTTTIKSVWQGEVYRKLREAHLYNHFQDHTFCGQCPDWVQTRWPGEGRSYADMVREFSEEQ